MKFLGVWPGLRHSRGINIHVLIPTTIISLFILAPPIVHVIQEGGDIIRVTSQLTSSMMALVSVSKLLITWYHSEVLGTVMSSMQSDWLNSNKWSHDIITKFARQAKIMAARCFFCMGTASVCYVCMQLTAFMNTRGESNRYLIHPTYFPFDVQRAPIYEIVFGCQLLGGIYTAILYTTIDNFISTVIIHISGQYMILRQVIKHMGSNTSEGSDAITDFRKRLSSVVERHEHLNWLATTVDGCYNKLLLGQFLGATFHLCFLVFRTYKIITEESVHQAYFKLIFLATYATQILINLHAYCYAGEKLREHSANIGNGVYECEWYNLPLKTANQLMIIVHRSTVPLTLNAGKFSTYTLELFIKIVKSSMGYVSVLLTMEKA